MSIAGERDARGRTHAAARALIGCGIAYAILYAVASDLVAASLYGGYSRMSQAVSELSATSAPTRVFLTSMLPIFSGLLIAFAIGVWKSAAGSRALRVTGAALAAHGVTGMLWLGFPMSSRADMIAGTMPANDLGHIVLSAATVALILVQVGAGAVAFGTRFRLYSLVTALVVLAFGALTSMEATKIFVGEPTPWMGLYERISIGAWLVWLAALSIAVSRRWTRTCIEPSHAARHQNATVPRPAR